MENDLYENDERTETDDSPYSLPTEPRLAPVVPTWSSNDPVRSPDVSHGSGYAADRPRVTVPPPPPPSRDSAARERMRKRRVKKRNKGSDWAWVVMAVATFGVVIIVSFSLFAILRASQEDIEVLPTAPVVSILPTAIDARTDYDPLGLGIGSELILDDGTGIEIKPWDGKSRFTMVMVGLDRRPGETGLAYRTDTMMLISVDPDAQTIGLLSIPRDLYVQVPGYSQLQRVNTPMVYGESRQIGYGPQLMMQTVELNLGIRVNDYLAVDFRAFVDLVDAIGGIDVDVPYTINDPQFPDMYYGYDPFYLTAGLHHLDGYTALKLARTRHNDNDFERARRQQMVLYAIRDRILSFDQIPNLVLQAPRLWTSLSENVYTGLSLEQIIQLGLYVKDIPAENIKMGVIDAQYIQPYSTSTGASVLIPNRARIGELMTDIFGPGYDQY